MKATSNLVSLDAEPSDIQDYQFLGVGGIATIAGFFVNGKGQQVGNSFTLSVPAANAGVQAPVNFGRLPSGDGTVAGSGLILTAYNTAKGLSNLATSLGYAFSVGDAPMGCIVQIENFPVYWGPGARITTYVTDMTTNPTNYPQLAIGQNIPFGSVNA